jgi:hypothetical protein
MVEAATRWAKEANITWTEVTSSQCDTGEPTTGGAVHFAVVKRPASESQDGGRSFFPDWAVSSRKFWVGTNIFNLTGYAEYAASSPHSLTKAADHGFFMHELGHIAGLDHEFGHSGWIPQDPTITTNCWDLYSLYSETGHSQANLTTAPDYCSVMLNPCQMSTSFFDATCAGIFDRKITSQDGYGMRALYGGPVIWPTITSSPLL